MPVGSKRMDALRRMLKGEQAATLHVPGIEGGAGDIIKRLTERIGVKPCASCEQRRQFLNRRLRFEKKLGAKI